MAYSKEVLEHYENPRNVGKLDKDDPRVGTGLTGAPACLGGDTLVALADGRSVAPISVLAAEGKDILIYAWDYVNNQYVVAIGVMPRKTREQAKTLLITFDDGSTLVCTPDHGLYKYSLNGQVDQVKVNASDLKPGDCVRPFKRKREDGYYRIYHGHGYDREHRMISSFLWGEDAISGKHIHHKNGNGFDNRPDNLEIMEPSVHNSEHMLGDLNPMRRFPEKNHFKNGFSGETNGRWIEVSNEYLVAMAKYNIPSLTAAAWVSYAKENNLPQNLSSRFGSFSQFKELVSGFNHRVVSVVDGPTQDVYCMTVPDYGCFATVQNGNDQGQDGVLVSNCGDVMKLQILVNEDGIIEDAKFKTFGCGSAIASSSLATEMIKGRSIDEAELLKNTTIVKELNLPPVKIHCSVLAESAIKAAIADYRRKNAEKEAETINLPSYSPESDDLGADGELAPTPVV